MCSCTPTSECPKCRADRERYETGPSYQEDDWIASIRERTTSRVGDQRDPGEGLR